MSRRIDITVADGERVLVVVNGNTGFPVTVAFINGIVSAYNGHPDDRDDEGGWS